MSEWQPIATAPKDGTEVLFWYAGDERARFPERPGHRIGKMEHMAGRWFPLIGCTIFRHDWDQFTHWHPLPEPPA